MELFVSLAYQDITMMESHAPLVVIQNVRLAIMDPLKNAPVALILTTIPLVQLMNAHHVRQMFYLVPDHCHLMLQVADQAIF